MVHSGHELRFFPAEVLSACDVFGVEKWQQISVFGIGASKKYRRMITHFLLSYFVYSQILLISLMDVSHFNYITKLKRKALGHPRWSKLVSWLVCKVKTNGANS
jgi:hypothetical protein